MKKQIFTIAIFFALAFPLIGSAQNFNFDTTNSTFLKVETNTDNGIVLIKLKPKETPKQEVLSCKDVNAVISFSFQAGKNRITGMKLKVNKVTLMGDSVLLIELQMALNNKEEPILGSHFAWLPNEKTPGFKMESVKRSFD